MLVRPMLLHRMALVSVRLFCKNLGNLQEFFGQMVYRPPLAKNCPYAYDDNFNETNILNRFNTPPQGRFLSQENIGKDSF